MKEPIEVVQVAVGFARRAVDLVKARAWRTGANAAALLKRRAIKMIERDGMSVEN